MKIVVKNDFSYLYLTTQIFSEKSILEAARVYEDFLKLSIKKFENYFTLKIESLTPDFSLEELTLEFMNFIVGQEHNGF